MMTVDTTLITHAAFSDDGKKRYLLSKTWDESKPRLAIVMLAPSEASGIAMDSTTALVLNNVTRLGYGSVAIVNLFSTLNDFSLKQTESEDPENMNSIVQAASTADCIVYAPGVGRNKQKQFLARQEQVLKALLPYEEKLHCLYGANNGGGRLQHPLSPAVRTWALAPFKVQELIPELAKSDSAEKKKTKGKEAKDPATK